ncbi:AfsR/SARP family transcriptional regulator [Allosaccharopolyspora coralli]|uniref:AfsR/SARP family transcriptional regulator n=1 Tax=Allosaccharopolyspora coralli TaxID=2665642 RepID=A0A5Q3QGK6_9PSEU|nr:BTAD domain-containing putative transcriptional regulator [Allosaccharopolyspora coralli]QGK70665.1 AfsR/SARP family transcriptional regulator [Allosaccharopolyspora coralli]
MRFGVLGPLQVWNEDGTPVRVPEVKVRGLLAQLLAHAGTVVSSDRLIDNLWADHQPANPANALQARVSQLRRALDDAEPGARELLVSRPPGYLLRVDPEAVDAGRFERVADRASATADPRARAALLDEALSLWRGAAFADFADEPFAQPSVARLEERRLAVLEDWAEARLELAEHRLLTGELEEAVTRHPLRERLRAAYLLALYRVGRQRDALNSYHDLRTRLRDEMGTDPGPELVELHRAILDHDPALQPPPAAPRTNLPAPLTELVGRSVDLTQVRELLAEHRVVTLVGVGGVGKTRLALETAHGVVGDFPDGVWLAELATFTSDANRPGARGLAEFLAEVLEVRDDPSAERAAPDSAARLVDAVRGRELLLVLDNCEHVVEPVVELAVPVLETAPGVKILATSRQPLEIPGEAVWTVAPLTVPDASASDGATAPAVALFAARAATADPGFALDDTNRADVAAICRRLDGIPLALELAAARVRSLGTRELAERLHDRFRLLAGGLRAGPERHQTLRATIDWSWNLLTATEQALLRRLSVHVGGASLRAVEEVCGFDELAPADVVDTAGRLVDRSLVTSIDTGDGRRYRLFESVAAYAAERLAEAGERETAQDRHAVHYLGIAEHAAPLLRGREQRHWLDRLDTESVNLRAALDRAVAVADAELALRLVDAMGWYWFLRGRLAEARRSTASALAVDPDASLALRAPVLTWHTGLMRWARETSGPPDTESAALRAYDELGDRVARAYAEWFLAYTQWGGEGEAVADERVERAFRTFQAEGEQWGMAAASATRGHRALLRDDLSTASREAERATDLFDELGDQWGRLQTLDTLGTLAEVGGNYDRAAELHTAGLRIAEELGLWNEASTRYARLGRIALLRGEHDAADDFHQRAARLAIAQSHRGSHQFAEFGLALVARRKGELDRAEKILHAWRDWNHEHGEHFDALMLSAELGFIAEMRGDAERARALHQHGYDHALTTGGPRAVAIGLEGLAGAWSLAGYGRDAAGLLGAADAARRSSGAPLPQAERHDVDRISARIRGEIGDAAFDAAFDEGASRELPPPSTDRNGRDRPR